MFFIPARIELAICGLDSTRASRVLKKVWELVSIYLPSWNVAGYRVSVRRVVQ